jgi:hypothetical protein
MKKYRGSFSEQLRELKATYSQKIWGKVYTEPNKEKALERCLELADFDICLDDIQADHINANVTKIDLHISVSIHKQNSFLWLVFVIVK